MQIVWCGDRQVSQNRERYERVGKETFERLSAKKKGKLKNSEFTRANKMDSLGCVRAELSGSMVLLSRNAAA